jgi:hypothetical protein
MFQSKMRKWPAKQPLASLLPSRRLIPTSKKIFYRSPPPPPVDFYHWTPLPVSRQLPCHLFQGSSLRLAAEKPPSQIDGVEKRPTIMDSAYCSAFEPIVYLLHACQR